jgi:hypothetical protein
MHYELFTLVLMAAFFFGMWCSALVGHRYGRRRVETVGESAAEGTGVVEAAMFALLGLLIAFTFATAYGRFNMRRDLVVQEANAIGTAYLRLDLLPAESQAPLREKFQAYVDSRLRFWEDLTHPDAAREDLGTSTRLQSEIWSEAVNASEDTSTARMLNAILARPPTLIFAMLFVLAVLCAWLIGYAMALAKKPNWLHIVGYAAMVTLTVYVILDMEYPRYGLIRLDVAQDMLVEVRKNISGNE